MRQRLRSVSGAVPLGLALIVVGVLLTLDNLAVLDAADLLAGWWPVAVIVAGLWWLLTGSTLTGLIVTAVGLLLATTQDLVEANVGRLILPVLLVVVGGGLLQAGWRVRTARIAVAGTASAAGAAGRRAVADGQAPPERSATAVFGDARIAVHDDGTEQGTVLVTATAVFGDVKVEVPPGWRVVDRVGRVFGDVSVPREQPESPDAPVVEVHGLVVFGDVSVRASERMKGTR